MGFKHAIVVGASSGIGLELAKQLAASGCEVAGLARRADRLAGIANVRAYKHDVRDYADIPVLFRQIEEHLGGLDLVIYAAGVMPESALDEFNFEKDRQIVETNVLGAMAWIGQAATRFQSTGKGSIVAIGSVAGDRGRAGRPAYNASKAALAVYMEAVRNRLATSGVSVVTIKPGPTRTEMNPHMDLKGVMAAADVASFVLAHADRSGEYYVKFSHRVVFALVRMMPGWMARKLPQ